MMMRAVNFLPSSQWKTIRPWWKCIWLHFEWLCIAETPHSNCGEREKKKKKAKHVQSFIMQKWNCAMYQVNGWERTNVGRQLETMLLLLPETMSCVSVLAACRRIVTIFFGSYSYVFKWACGWSFLSVLLTAARFLFCGIAQAISFVYLLEHLHFQMGKMKLMIIIIS